MKQHVRQTRNDDAIQLTYIKRLFNCVRYMPVKTVKTVKIATLLAGVRRFNNVHDFT